MKNLSAEERRNLVAGTVVALVAGFVVFRMVAGGGILPMFSPVVDVPGFGTTGILEVVVSILIAVGGFVWQTGVPLLKKLVGYIFSPSDGGDSTNILDSITPFIRERIKARDFEGVRLAYDLFCRCEKDQTDQVNKGPAA